MPSKFKLWPLVFSPFLGLSSLIVLSYPDFTFAVDDKFDKNDIFNISIEELLDVKVSGVSKKKENLDKAPGVVTVITATQIKELAARNLTDVLVTIPGLFAFDNYFSLTDQFSLRGNLVEDYNTKILFLINGHPSYHTLNGTFFSDMVPIQAIERVEVVRGAVSVLYGTNALTGVINIITKQDLAENDVNVSIQAGNHGTHIGKLNLLNKWQEGQLFISAELKSSDGFNQTITAAQDDAYISFKEGFVEVYAGDGGEIVLAEEHTALFAQLKHQDLDIDLSYFTQDRSQKHGILPSLYFRGKPFDVELIAADARYNYNYSENLNLRFIARFDDYQYIYTVGNYQQLDVGLADDGVREAVGEWNGQKYGAEVIADWTYDSWDLITGIMYDKYKGKRVSFETGETSAFWFSPDVTGINANFELIPNDSENDDTAIYTNGRYKFSDQMEGVAGIRYTDNKASGGHLDYRIGSIYSVTENTIIKALWGTSYRSANLNEYNVSATPVIIGNPSLDFETLEGLDLALIQKGENYALTVNYYQNETDDEISTRLIQDDNVGFPVPTYTNVQGKKTRGIEFELTYLFSNDLKTYLRMSKVLDVEDLESGNDISDGTITRMQTAGLAWKVNDKLKINFNALYNGDWQNDGAYSVFSTSANYQINDQFDLFAEIYNLADKEFTYAIWQGNGQAERLPAGKPRTVSLGLQYNW